MTKAEQAIENDKLHLVSAIDAAIVERDSEHPQTGGAPLCSHQAVPPADADAWQPDNADIVCVDQPAIMIYTNKLGQAVIRQQQQWDEEEDSFIRIGKHYLQDVIDRLQAVLSANERG